MSGPVFRVVPAQHDIVFDRPGEFVASRDAEAFLANNGFAIGPSQRGAPRAVMFGNYAIAKWKNLNHSERCETHGTLTGDGRDGPVIFRLLPAAPEEAVRAIARATGSADTRHFSFHPKGDGGLA